MYTIHINEKNNSIQQSSFAYNSIQRSSFAFDFHIPLTTQY